ncbi:hypothetical protein FOL47_001474 [Perkinsus chesapeaki]|uniref:Uncharacterized protein n=1 Tax=Perkinsus chesapeaki TaxID=330153 RepID=A0A7J6KT73_PERCH|nr:hypothetical protein FOL47_001474 [Perkinsus chesapeaki]
MANSVDNWVNKVIRELLVTAEIENMAHLIISDLQSGFTAGNRSLDKSLEESAVLAFTESVEKALRFNPLYEPTDEGLIREAKRRAREEYLAIQDAESRLKTALRLGAKGTHIRKKMEPVFKASKELNDSLPKQEAMIMREIERLMEMINNERRSLAEQRGTLKQERRAFDFERRTSQADIGDVNGLRDRLRDTEGRMHNLEQDLDKERRRNSQGITPRPLSPVLHPADKEQAIDMLNKATKELEKVTEERDTALLEAQRIAKDLKRKEEQVALLERENSSSIGAAEEEIRQLREKVKSLAKANDTRATSPHRPPLTSTEGPPVVFVDPVLPSVSSSIATTPRSGENDENDDRGTLEQLLDALTGRKDDETETQHLLHSLEHVTECLTERCRVLETALNDAKRELKWWRTGGGTATFNEYVVGGLVASTTESAANNIIRAYAKAMAENERHVRLEEQRHRKEKADLERRVTESERRKVCRITGDESMML